jgi:glycine cleavage system H protein
MNVPADLRFTSDHEWARVEETGTRVGITDFAQDALGPVVFVQLPEPGSEIAKGGKLGEVESTKSVSEIYAPVGGVVVEVNTELVDEGAVKGKPELLNEDPYGAGWLCVIRPTDPADAEQLLDAEGYQAILPA